jgi:hypothetical protein
MATGLLGSGTLSAGSTRTTSTIYTVPSSGVSYAVVHITIAMEPEDTDGDHVWVTVAGHKVLTLIPSGGGYGSSSHGKYASNSVSMMLSPGNTVVLSVYRAEVSCTVSGYEVA